MITKVRVSSVYNSPPWGICQLTINELAVLWDVPMLLQEKLEEIDQKFLLVHFLSSVLVKELLLSSDYLISLSILGGWCSMPHIYQKVEIRDTVIQQVFSISVPKPLTIMEDDVVGAILKYDGMK